MNINKMLGIFGLQLKSKKEPVKKVSRNGLSQKYHKEYQTYHLYFITKKADWKKNWKCRKNAAERTINSYVKLNNALIDAVQIFGTEEEKNEVMSIITEKISYVSSSH